MPRRSPLPLRSRMGRYQALESFRTGAESLRKVTRSSQAGSVDGTASAEQVSTALRPAPTVWNQAMDASLSDLGCAATLHTDGSGGNADRLSARSRTHARTGSTAGASHCRGGQTGLARVTASHQRSTGTAGYRRYLGCNHRGRVGSGVPLRRCSATDGYCGAVPSEDSSGKRTRRGSITKTCNSHLRRIVVESAWSYHRPPCIWYGLRKRQESISEEAKEIAWKAQHRLHKRYVRLAAAGKDKRKITIAVARELLGFIWAIGIRAETVARQRIAA
ncbi:transposase IS116/IS110/IS902 family protein [Edaphobacter modestus]|uniref:Transposase IS116/IS110/IS902 family protein n=1 Tax=Edaphobacter modestus TaxID=388466 RepID=A0A4Q7YUZ1_9BACT|nr:transposase IS116/IS110/IS902 family protein [Edaphobacter modestus]